MDNPISLILADIVMPDLEKFTLSKLCFESVFYFRYIDDMLLCVPSNMIDITGEYPTEYVARGTMRAAAFRHTQIEEYRRYKRADALVR